MTHGSNKDRMTTLFQNAFKSTLHKERSMLYKNNDFILLHVASNSETMSIIRPCHSSYHRWKVKSKGYYALSHLWGNAKDFPYWDVGTFITQDKHPVDPIPMRPEKRETLLALLKQHPDTYWWIDVLCARTDTPLVIMGDIYKHSRACYAMLDCAPELITRIWKNANYFIALRETYERFISGMCDESKNVHVMFDESQTFKMTAIRSIAEKHSWVLDALCSLFQSSWFDRVWTLQEIALPAKTIMISEQCGFATIEHQISFDLLSGFLYNLDADSDCIDFLSGIYVLSPLASCISLTLYQNIRSCG